MGIGAYLNVHLSVPYVYLSVQLCFICMHVYPHIQICISIHHVCLCVYTLPVESMPKCECTPWLTECMCSKHVNVKVYSTCVSHVYPKYTSQKQNLQTEHEGS